MSFSPTLAAVRFGYGLSPTLPAPASVEAMLAAARGPDTTARRITLPTFEAARPAPKDYVLARRQQMHAETQAERQAGEGAVRQWRQEAIIAGRDAALRTLARCVTAEDMLRERLTAFWADHFTAVPRTVIYRHLVTPYVEEAIRPHVMGRFADMLIRVTMHPIMLLSLQQAQSVGENSPFGRRRGRGLNENLAREVIELHTLGAGGAYRQRDVRELAELLTGLTYHPLSGFRFQRNRAEPGAEIVLGKTYGPEPGLATVTQVLEDLARHPDTARHLAGKMITHFVSEVPDTDFVEDLADVFRATDGNLGALTEALVRDPRAWHADRRKVRQPFEYIAAALRALGVDGARILAADDRSVRRLLQRPLRVMGQPWQAPTGPDGWPEDNAHWIIPQAMAGRISWAMQAPAEILGNLPDPRAFVAVALGDDAPAAVRFAAGAAETRAEGVGLVLASPAFQRR